MIGGEDVTLGLDSMIDHSALGLSDDQTRSSLRFGLGRFNTADEVEFAIGAVRDAVLRLRRLSSQTP